MGKLSLFQLGPKTKKRRRGGAGKRKGGAFEREVCQRLSLWFSVGKRDDLFWRSSMSGGRATVKHKKGHANETQVGDVSAIHPDGARLTDHVVIECKFYRDLTILGGIFENIGLLYKFWDKLLPVAGARHPMLIARQNRTATLVLMTADGARCIGLPLSTAYVRLLQWERQPYVFSLEDFAP